MFTAQGPQVLCFMTLEGFPRYRGGSCAICTGLASLHNNTLSRRTMTVCSNDTLVDAPFQLISGFMLIKVFCVLSMLNKLPPGVCWRGGGGGGGGGQQAC